MAAPLGLLGGVGVALVTLMAAPMGLFLTLNHKPTKPCDRFTDNKKTTEAYLNRLLPKNNQG